ncbi:MAG: DUF177 domain-containing protein [Deltaproteobacteria bacterium]|nr:DUF177 domain-containing protein [Deltaproteobacteria bacterium]MBW2305499.1 DUF177 domain-containing protein [Deltaproteobacteria bacterium]
MKFRLQEIPREEKEFVHVYGISEVIQALQERDVKEIHPLEPIEARVRLIRSEKQVFSRGLIRGKMETTCSRCLGPFAIPIKLEFQQAFLPRTKALNLEELELSADDLDTSYYSGDTLDLNPIIWDELILEIPFIPLCREDCRGLCPMCGANLNEGECLCSPPPADSRWEALRQLKP